MPVQRPSNFAPLLEAVKAYKAAEVAAQAAADFSGIGPLWANVLLCYGAALLRALPAEVLGKLAELAAVNKLLEPYEVNPQSAADFLYTIGQVPDSDRMEHMAKTEEFLMSLGAAPPRPKLSIVN